MKDVGLKFLLQGGHYFMAVLSEKRAKEVHQKWLEGTYKLHGPTIIGESTDKALWAVDMSQVVGLHTVDVQVQPSAPVPVPATPMSGMGYQHTLAPWLKQ
jgi:hypothetical protein